MLPTLTLAISSLENRIARIFPEDLPKQNGLEYLLLLQGKTDPGLLLRFRGRSDIRIIQLETTGVAHSRNTAIEHAASEIILFADDDLDFETESYMCLRRRFARAATVDFVCGRLRNAEGGAFKPYQDDGAKVSKLNSGRVGTPELAIRTHVFRERGVKFDINFGAGSHFWLGDEYIFICDALRKGLSGVHISLHFGTHLTESSGILNRPESMRIRKAVLRRALSPFSWPYRLAFALKHRKRFTSFVSFLHFVSP